MSFAFATPDQERAIAGNNIAAIEAFFNDYNTVTL